MKIMMQLLHGYKGKFSDIKNQDDIATSGLQLPDPLTLTSGNKSIDLYDANMNRPIISKLKHILGDSEKLREWKNKNDRYGKFFADTDTNGDGGMCGVYVNFYKYFNDHYEIYLAVDEILTEINEKISPVRYGGGVNMNKKQSNIKPKKSKTKSKKKSKTKYKKKSKKKSMKKSKKKSNK